MVVADRWVLARWCCGVKQVCGISLAGALGALAVFLSLQTVLALLQLLSLATTLVTLRFRMLRLGGSGLGRPPLPPDAQTVGEPADD